MTRATRMPKSSTSCFASSMLRGRSVGSELRFITDPGIRILPRSRRHLPSPAPRHLRRHARDKQIRTPERAGAPCQVQRGVSRGRFTAERARPRGPAPPRTIKKGGPHRPILWESQIWARHQIRLDHFGGQSGSPEIANDSWAAALRHSSSALVLCSQARGSRVHSRPLPFPRAGTGNSW